MERRDIFIVGIAILSLCVSIGTFLFGEGVLKRVNFRLDNVEKKTSEIDSYVEYLKEKNADYGERIKEMERVRRKT